MRYAPFLLAASLSACSRAPEPAPAPDPAPAAEPAALAPGTTLHYTRSNSDGSMPERILVHIVSPTELAVAKMVERCTSAALVTAAFDATTGEAQAMVGGRLGRDGEQVPQVFLTPVHDETTGRRLDVRFGEAHGPVAESIPAPPAPWRIYDFDFAEFALFGPRSGEDFAWGLAMTWPAGDPPMLHLLGEATAAFAGTGEIDGQSVNRFTIAGPAFGAKGGEISFDAATGHVVKARLAAPNHPGYTDFLLKLDRIAEGETAWREDLAAHWRDCPA